MEVCILSRSIDVVSRRVLQVEPGLRAFPSTIVDRDTLHFSPPFEDRARSWATMIAGDGQIVADLHIEYPAARALRGDGKGDVSCDWIAGLDHIWKTGSRAEWTLCDRERNRFPRYELCRLART